MVENKKMPKTDEKPQLDAARVVELLTRAEHISKKQLYLQNFLRGIFLGAGSVLGATLLIGLLLWTLSLFDTVPLIGPLFDQTRETIEQGQGSR